MQLKLLEQDVSHNFLYLVLLCLYIVLPPSVSIIPVENIYTIGDTVTLTCTVIANVPDPRNTAYIRWRRNNEDIMTTVISPTPVNDSINYTYPLTIYNINLSDAGQYSCTARIRSNGITNVMGSDTVTNYTIVNIKCKYAKLPIKFHSFIHSFIHSFNIFSSTSCCENHSNGCFICNRR